MLYDNIRAACASRGTTLTQALQDIGRASGVVGNWKQGGYPNMKVAMELADHLHMSLDELCYGPARAGLSDDEAELLGIFRSIPADKHQMCLDFLRTHVAETPATPAAKEA